MGRFPSTSRLLTLWRGEIALLVFLLLLLLGCCVASQVAHQRVVSQASTAARQSVALIEKVLAYADLANQEIHNLVGQPCQEVLPILRMVATRTPYIRTINLVMQETVYCSSLLGDLNQVVKGTDFAVGGMLLLSGNALRPSHPVVSLRYPAPAVGGAVVINIDSTYLAMKLSQSALNGQAWLRIGDRWLDDGGNLHRAISDNPLWVMATNVSLLYPFAVTVAPPFTFVTRIVNGGWVLVVWIAVSLFGSVVLWRWWGRAGWPENELTRGIKAQEFVPYVQPVVDARTHQLSGVEVLMRWQHAEEGLVEPACFIAQAEESGLIVPMTSQIMAQVVHSLIPLQVYLPLPFHVSINICAAHFTSNTLLEDCKAFLAGFLPGRVVLILELTERELLRNDHQTQSMFNQLMAIGVQFALDDFGTGNASLAYLKEFPVQIIKLDGSFVRKIGVDNLSQNIVDSIIDLGMKLGLEIVAEGVETISQADYLSSRGVDLFQGYLFGAPQPMAAFEASFCCAPVDVNPRFLLSH